MFSLRLPFLATVLYTALTVSACALPQDSANPTTAELAPGIVFASSPGASVEADMTGLLENSTLMEQGSVRVLSRYSAASGKKCALMAVSDTTRNWTGCSYDGRSWHVAPSFLTADAMFGSSR